MGFEAKQLGSIARYVVEVLKERQETLAVCESLTGGLAAASIVEIPGASTVFRGGLVTYATDLKATLAGVDKQLLDLVGPVAPETAEHMAEGARKVCGADWGVSFTGFAGPDGTRVGEVFVGVAGPAGTTAQRALIDEHTHVIDGVEVLDGDRNQIRQWAVVAGLSALLEQAQN